MPKNIEYYEGGNKKNKSEVIKPSMKNYCQ